MMMTSVPHFIDQFARNRIHAEALRDSNAFNTCPDISGKSVVFVALGCDLAKEELYRYIFTISNVKAIVVESEGNELVKRLVETCPNVLSIEISLESRPTLVDEVKAAIDSVLVHEGIPKLDAVMTYWDDSVALTARLASCYDVPTNPIYSVDLAHDKARSRQFLREKGYASPRSEVITSRSALVEASRQSHFNFPAILKPVFGAASIGVVKVSKVDELVDKYDEVIEILKACYADNELMGLTFDDAEELVQPSLVLDEEQLDPLLHVVLEEFLQGREYDCDIVLHNDDVVWCELCDDWDYKPPHFVELGSNVPTTSPPDREKAVKEYAANVVRAMGLTMGVHHVEVIDDVNLGPVLVECNPRMGGGPVRMNHMLVHRVDLAIAALYSSLGLCSIVQGIDPPPLYKVHSNATACLYATESGVLTVDTQTLLDKVIEPFKENVVVATSGKPAGSSLKGWNSSGSHPSGLGLLSISIKGPVAEAKDLVNRLREDFLVLVSQHLLPENQMNAEEDEESLSMNNTPIASIALGPSIPQ